MGSISPTYRAIDAATQGGSDKGKIVTAAEVTGIRDTALQELRDLVRAGRRSVALPAANFVNRLKALANRAENPEVRAQIMAAAEEIGAYADALRRNPSLAGASGMSGFDS